MQIQISEGHLGGYIIGQAAPGTWCPKVWDWLIDENQVSSMLDIGCGLGFAMKYFHERDCEVAGVDGSPSAIRDSVMPHHVYQHDFSLSAWYPEGTYDLVWSAEFLEHVEECFIDNYLNAFQASRNLIVVTYARIGQGGHHHVNENTEEYWIEKFTSIGFEFELELTSIARSLVPAEGNIGKQFRNKGIVFKRK